MVDYADMNLIDEDYFWDAVYDTVKDFDITLMLKAEVTVARFVEYVFCREANQFEEGYEHYRKSKFVQMFGEKGVPEEIAEKLFEILGNSWMFERIQNPFAEPTIRMYDPYFQNEYEARDEIASAQDEDMFEPFEW